MAFLDQPDNGLPLILVEDGALLGLCLLQRLAAPLDGGGQLCLDDLYVRVAARGRGLGGALMKGAEALGRALGVRYLYLHVEPENTAAQALYARHGLVRTDSLIMDKLYF
jgi:ribosomal protein S18 acetylase RimI-like enzyme